MIEHEIAKFRAGNKDFQIIRSDDDAYEIKTTVWNDGNNNNNDTTTTLDLNREQLEMFMDVVYSLKGYFKMEDSKA